MRFHASLALAALAFAPSVRADLDAKTFVKIGDQSVVDGAVNAGTYVQIGGLETINGPITACQQVSILDQSSLSGVNSPSVTPAPSTWASHQITGPDWNLSSVCQVPPVLTSGFATGSGDVTVPLRTRTTLTAANRGNVTVQDGGVLTLGPGIHQFASLTTGVGVQIILQDSASLKVRGNVQLGNYAIIAGGGSTKFALEIGGNLVVGTNGNIPFDVIANGDITFADRPVVTNLTGNSITLGVGSKAHGKPDVVVSGSQVVFSDNFEEEGANTYGKNPGTIALTNWDIVNSTTGSVDVIANNSTWPLVPVQQGNVVDMEGSYNSSSAMPATLATKTTFPAGRYQLSLKLAGSLRSVVPDNYEVLVTFGDYTQMIRLPWNQTFQTFTANVTLSQPSKLVIAGQKTTTTVTMAGLLLDDVSLTLLP